MDRPQSVSFPSSGLRQERMAPSELAWAEGTLWVGQHRGLERLDMPPGVGVSGLESNWRQSVLLWRRKQRQGGNRPPIQVRLSGPQRLKALLDPQACGYRSLDLSSFARDRRNVVKSRHCFPTCPKA